jgi:glycerophosphoryl diester phosphodiesterase
MQIIGHRGACGHAPENTLASFKDALRLGADAVELDVYCLRSGEVVVIHDDRVDRTTNGAGYVMDFSFKALRQLDAGRGQQVPLLSEVLDLIDKKIPVNIELKGEGTAGAVAEIIQDYTSNKDWSDELFIVSSFNHVELSTFARLMPGIRTGALIVGIPVDYAAFAQELGAFSVNLSIEFITPEFVKDAHDRGLKVSVFTVNESYEVDQMQSLGVDGIFTNYPDRARSYILKSIRSNP